MPFLISTMRFILAVSDNDVIALNGRLPWHIPHDLKYFKMNTLHDIVIMGRKTWESLPYKPLKNRHNLVVTSKFIKGVDCIDVKDVRSYDGWVIGGAKLFESVVEKGDLVYLTHVHAAYRGDVTTIKLPNMTEIYRSKDFVNDGLGYHFSINKVFK